MRFIVATTFILALPLFILILFTLRLSLPLSNVSNVVFEGENVTSQVEDFRATRMIQTITRTLIEQKEDNELRASMRLPRQHHGES